jgi:hypothetical protein
VTERRWAAAAIRNNAEWCDLVCRVHGATTTFDEAAWTSDVRTPLYYPDAVTLSSDVAAAEVLARIDGSDGCSVKDSFATLDLGAHGFRVLFDAQWIVSDGLPPCGPDQHRWEPLRDRQDLAAWQAAWQGDEDQPSVSWPRLYDCEQVTFLASYARDRIVAGAIVHRAAGVVGISNVFADPAGGDAWDGCTAVARELHLGVPLVGYAFGQTLEWALDSGFTSAGPLRVWLLDHK